MGFVCCFFGFPEGFFKTKKTFEKTRYQRKQTNTQKNLRENHKNNKVFKGFRPTLGYVFFCLFFFGFPERFFQNQKTKPISKGGSETFKRFVFFGFPEVFFYFFGFLWYFWFSRSFFCFFRFLKNFRENQKTKQDQTHIQTQGAQGRNNSFTIE